MSVHEHGLSQYAAVASSPKAHYIAAHVHLCRPPRRPSRAIEGRPPRRLRRPAHRRAYERICRQLCPAARLADRVRGLGGLRGRAARGSGDLHRRALHAAGPRARSTASIGRYESVPQTSIADWLKEHAPEGARIGYDPWLHTRDWVEQATEALAAQGRRAGRRRRATRSTRSGRTGPRRRRRTSIVQPDEHAGQIGRRQAHRDRRLAGEARSRRGGDLGARFDRLGVQHPRRGRRAHAGRAGLCASSTPTAPPTCSSPRRRSTPEVRQHLGNGVRLHDRATRSRRRSPSSRARRSRSIPSARSRRSSRRSRRRGAKVVALRDPTILPKAVKNPVEIAGQNAAQARDGAAISRFLHWVEEEAPKGEVDELTRRDQLEALRRETRRTSRPVVRHASPAPGPTARSSTTSRARRPTASSSPARSTWSIRAANISTAPPTSPAPSSIGEPTDGDARPLHPRAQGPYRDRHARSSRRARAAASSTASRAGPCGRRGSTTPTAPATASAASSSVHEGPQRIASAERARPGGDEPLLAGMILSNEPGYYKTGEYGIRIENLVLVVEREIDGAEKEMLGLRDADLRADRPAADRGVDARARGTRVAQRYHAHVLAKHRARSSRAPIASGWKRLARPLTSASMFP